MPGRRSPRQIAERAASQHTDRVFLGGLNGASTLPAPVTQDSVGKAEKKSPSISFFNERFTAVGGNQTVILTFLPIANSEHVYLYPGGATSNGLYCRQGKTWTRDAGKRNLSVLLGMNARSGDVIVVEYAYYSGGETEEPAPYNMFAGPWRDPRIGAIYYKLYSEPIPTMDPAIYYTMQSPVLSAGQGSMTIGSMISYIDGSTALIQNNSPGYVAGDGNLLILASNVKYDQLCGMMLFGTKKEQPSFRSWTPARDLFSSGTTLYAEWQANKNIVGFQVEGRCTYLDANRLPKTSNNPEWQKWYQNGAAGGGYDTYWTYCQEETDPRVYSDTSLSDFTFTAVYDTRQSANPPGQPFARIYHESEMQTIVGSNLIHYCPPSMTYSGIPLPRPPESGAYSPKYDFILTWPPDGKVRGWFIGWTETIRNMTQPFNDAYFAWATNQTSYGNSHTQQMATLTTNLRWRFLYLSKP